MLKKYDYVSANTASSVPKTSKYQCGHRVIKLVVPAVNLAYLDTLYVHPVIRPIFCNILGLNWQY